MECRSDKLLKKVLQYNGIIISVIFVAVLIVFTFGDCSVQDFVVNRIGFLVLTMIFGQLFISILYIYFISDKD